MSSNTLYWSIPDRVKGTDERVMLCEKHALQASNHAYMRAGLTPAKTMNEAAVFLASMMASAGLPDPDFQTHELGSCSACEDGDEAA